jgi:pimeloyl-ACP methyl ester carboxylesterase
VRPQSEWTWPLVPAIVEEVRKLESRPDMPFYFIGHSGGGQFLIRLAAFTPTQVRRIVVSNPGTYLFPSRDYPYPFGFGGLPDELSSDDMLRRFLAQPITLYLAMNDLERDEHFNQTPPAERQGRTRWERGQNAFQLARELARSKGWEFRWRLVAVENVGHDHQAMFDHALCEEALFGRAAPTE